MASLPLPDPLPPIVYIAFRRPRYVEQVLRALQRQTVTPGRVIAFVDGPRSDADKAGVDACIELLSSDWDFPLECHVRTGNLGVTANVTESLEEVFRRFPYAIYLEEDVLPAPAFYGTVSRLLGALRNDQSFFAVSAFTSFPSQAMREHLTADFFVHNHAYFIGCGLWADRWQQVVAALTQGPSRRLRTLMKIPRWPLTFHMPLNYWCYLIGVNRHYWDTCVRIEALLRGLKTISPRFNLTAHIGFGNESLNMKRNVEAFNLGYREEFVPDRLPESFALAPSYTTPVPLSRWIASDLRALPRVTALTLLSALGPRIGPTIRKGFHLIRDRQPRVSR